MINLEFVDRALVPIASPGTLGLPRNAMVLLTFSDTISESSVSASTIQVRLGGSVVTGASLVSGNQVVYDPTSGAEGRPSVYGFAPNTSYSVLVPGTDTSNLTVTSGLGAPPAPIREPASTSLSWTP